MKNRGFFLIVFALVVMAAMTSCEKTDPDEGDGSLISITTPSQKAMFSGSDTLYVEPGAVVILEASSNGPTIASWSWVCDGTAKSGQQVEYVFNLQPPAISRIELIATDQTGTVYKKTIPVKAVYTLDGLAAVVVVSANKIGDNLFSLVMAFHKNGMLYNGTQFFYIGNVTDPVWQRKEIAPADTNWLVVIGALTAPEIGDIGKYVVVRLELTPKAYEMGVGKIVNGSEWWGNFWGAFIANRTMIKFTLKNDGTIIPSGDGGEETSVLPGKVGDQAVRAEVSGNNLIIYTYNGLPFSSLSPFIKTQYPNGIWAAPLSQQVVNGYDKWGKLEISLSQLSIGGMLAFRYGSQLSQPMIYNEAQKNSIFWDSYYKVLKIVCRQVKSANLSGNEQESWIITSGVTMNE